MAVLLAITVVCLLRLHRHCHNNVVFHAELYQGALHWPSFLVFLNSVIATTEWTFWSHFTRAFSSLDWLSSLVFSNYTWVAKRLTSTWAVCSGTTCVLVWVMMLVLSPTAISSSIPMSAVILTRTFTAGRFNDLFWVLSWQPLPYHHLL